MTLQKVRTQRSAWWRKVWNKFDTVVAYVGLLAVLIVGVYVLEWIAR